MKLTWDASAILSRHIRHSSLGSPVSTSIGPGSQHHGYSTLVDMMKVNKSIHTVYKVLHSDLASFSEVGRSLSRDESAGRAFVPSRKLDNSVPLLPRCWDEATAAHCIPILLDAA
jgi:hypothetical protein